MEVAAEFQRRTREIKDAETALDQLKQDIKPYHARMIDLIEQGKLPESFRGPHGGNIHMSSQLWASAKDKDHDRLASVLKSLGMVEFLPSTVNSQKISGYVREFRDETGKVIIAENPGDYGLPKELADALNIREQFTVKAT